MKHRSWNKLEKVKRDQNPKTYKKKLAYLSSSESASFLLVIISSKKTVKYFAAEVTASKDDYYDVKYLKKDKVYTQRFTHHDPQTYELDKNYVLFKLPHPVLTGGYERQLKKLIFGVHLCSYNEEWLYISNKYFSFFYFKFLFEFHITF